MKISLICTTEDQASMNIKRALLKSLEWSGDDVLSSSYGDVNLELHTFDSSSVFLENVDLTWDNDITVFCTKHQSKSGIPSFSVHCPGNFTKAEYGGNDKVLCIAHSELMYHCYHALFKLNEESHLPHEVVYEVTHHGPVTSKPTMFIEIGSCEKYWSEEVAGDLLAKALLEGISNLGSVDMDSIIGIGGLHTCPSFNKISIREQAMIGHVCPAYMLENLDVSLLKQMVEKTIPRPSAIVLDWKGLSKSKQHILEVIDEADLGIEVKKTKEYSLKN